MKYILLGYDEEAGSRVYRLYNPVMKRIQSSRDVIIDESNTRTSNRLEIEMGNEIEVVLPEYEQTRGEERGREHTEEISAVEITGADQNQE